MDQQNWKAQGEMVNCKGRSFFVVDQGKKEAPVLLILHGYPSCSFDYWRTLPFLTQKFRVILHDHLGFGFSDKPTDFSYSLIEQAEMALALWQQLGIRKASILAHDYGTSILCEIVARWNYGFRPVKINALVLGNGSMLIDQVQLLLSQKLLMNKTTGPWLTQLATRWYFHYNMKKLWADPAKYDAQDMDILYDINFTPASRKVFATLSRYNLERRKYWDRWITKGIFQTDLPVRIFWGDQDPIAVIGMAHRLQKNIPGSRLEILENVGHYPMLEVPEIWAKTILLLLKKN